MMHTLYTDGGSRGNPGNSATGYFLFDDSQALISYGGDFLGTATNNQAEYEALLAGLKLAKKSNSKMLLVCMDSELIIKQLKGEYKVKNPEMKKLYTKVQKQIENFDSVAFKHVPRAENKFADKMVNIILDTKAGK